MDSNKTKPYVHGGTVKRTKGSIKKDYVHPGDYNKYDSRWSCEDCSHFDAFSEACTLGYTSEFHRKSVQEASYALSGKIAFCRFHEID